MRERGHVDAFVGWWVDGDGCIQVTTHWVSDGMHSLYSPSSSLTYHDPTADAHPPSTEATPPTPPLLKEEGGGAVGSCSWSVGGGRRMEDISMCEEMRSSRVAAVHVCV